MELDETSLMEILRDLLEHEVQTQKVIEGLENKLQDRDKVIDTLLKEHQLQMKANEQKFRGMEMKLNEMSMELRNGLTEIKAEVAKKPLPIHRQFRFPLFPENNPERFYNFVFKRLLWWCLALFISVCLINWGFRYIEALETQHADQNVELAAEAWIKLYETGNKATRDKMREVQRVVEKQH